MFCGAMPPDWAWGLRVHHFNLPFRVVTRRFYQPPFPVPRPFSSWEKIPVPISDLRIKFYAKWIEFLGEHDIDPDQTGHLQNFANSFWFRLVRVGSIKPRRPHDPLYKKLFLC
jgi:hypothetical protein